jgi:bifunctional DNA-binding transcriptional regulator/antitoxin component of YhaV-PrlF toxin-antitoxin module
MRITSLKYPQCTIIQGSCDTDRYLVVTKVRERLSARKQDTLKTDVKRFNIKRLSEMKVRKQFQIEISNRFEALENLNDSEDINRASENIRENIKISAKETLGLYRQKQHKLWFDEERSQVLGQRKQAKMQWLQNPNHSNLDNLNNTRQETSRHFRNKKREYLKTKIMN